MTNPFEDDKSEYVVVINKEEQYSLWPAFKTIPAGWSATGTRGSRKVCLDWIEQVWTDMRPKSLRDAMDGARNAE
jgi:MbtH protein